MGALADWNRRTKKFSMIDVKLAQWASVFLGLIAAKAFPQILNVSIWWFWALLLICGIKPFYVFWIKGE